MSQDSFPENGMTSTLPTCHPTAIEYQISISVISMAFVNNGLRFYVVRKNENKLILSG